MGRHPRLVVGIHRGEPVVSTLETTDVLSILDSRFSPEARDRVIVGILLAFQVNTAA